MNSHIERTLVFVGSWVALALSACGGGDGPAGKVSQPQTCSPTGVCAEALTCVDGQQYPTACGPRNCDKPLGPCPDASAARPPPPACDPTLVCAEALTCVGGQQYPTTCGPRNCDKPLGPC